MRLPVHRPVCPSRAIRKTTGINDYEGANDTEGLSLDRALKHRLDKPLRDIHVKDPNKAAVLPTQALLWNWSFVGSSV